MPRSGVTLAAYCKSENIDVESFLIDPTDAYKVSYMSHKILGFKCSLGHEITMPVHRFMTSYKKNGNAVQCPYCNGFRVLVGFNDLKTTRPDLAAEWDYEKNELTPLQVTRGSHKDVWWRCSYGHSWKARISARDYGNGCPHCSKVKRSSIPEQVVFYYVKKYFPDALSRERFGGVEADVYIPSLKVAIEYDGGIWHTRDDHEKKVRHFKPYGIRVYTISGVQDAGGEGVFAYDDSLNNGIYLCDDFYVCISSLLQTLGVDSVDYSDIKEAFAFARKEYYSSCNQYAEVTDVMRSMWSERLNGYPVDCISNDNMDKYWVCEYGHTFKRRYDVFKRTETCPYCTRKKSFRFFLLCRNEREFIIFDRETMELESINRKELIWYIKYNCTAIRGVLLDKADNISFFDYYTQVSGTEFYSLFRDEDNGGNKELKLSGNTEYLRYVYSVINYLLANLSYSKSRPAMEYLFMAGNADKYVSRANLLSIK